MPAPPLGAVTMPVKGGPDQVRTLMLRCSAAIQPVGTSRDLDSVRPHARWPADRIAAGRAQGPHAGARAGRARGGGGDRLRDPGLLSSLGAGARRGQQGRTQGPPVRMGRRLDRSGIRDRGSGIRARSRAPDLACQRGSTRSWQDTDAFFTPEPTRYTFTQAPDTVRATGEEGVLTFASGFTTPHEKNNTVVARYFPANPDSQTEAGIAAARGRRARAVELRC